VTRSSRSISKAPHRMTARRRQTRRRRQAPAAACMARHAATASDGDVWSPAPSHGFTTTSHAERELLKKETDDDARAGRPSRQPFRRPDQDERDECVKLSTSAPRRSQPGWPAARFHCGRSRPKCPRRVVQRRQRRRRDAPGRAAPPARRRQVPTRRWTPSAARSGKPVASESFVSAMSAIDGADSDFFERWLNTPNPSRRFSSTCCHRP